MCRCWGNPMHTAAAPSVSTVLHLASSGLAWCHACFVVIVRPMERESQAPTTESVYWTDQVLALHKVPRLIDKLSAPTTNSLLGASTLLICFSI